MTGVNWAMDSPPQRYHAWLYLHHTQWLNYDKVADLYAILSSLSCFLFSSPSSPQLRRMYIPLPQYKSPPWEKSGPITAWRSENTWKLFGDRVCPTAKQLSCISIWKLCLNVYVVVSGRSCCDTSVITDQCLHWLSLKVPPTYRRHHRLYPLPPTVMTHRLHPPNARHLLIKWPWPIALIKILNVSVSISLCNIAQHWPNSA